MIPPVGIEHEFAKEETQPLTTPKPNQKIESMVASLNIENTKNHGDKCEHNRGKLLAPQ